MPELSAWNDGDGIGLDDWAFITGKSDAMIAFAEIFWPDFVEVENMVLRRAAGVEEQALQRLDAGQPRQQIEQHLNFWDFGAMFEREKLDEELLEKRRAHLCHEMSDMLRAKLARDFPGRTFEVLPNATGLDENDDLEVTFWQPHT